MAQQQIEQNALVPKKRNELADSLNADAGGVYQFLTFTVADETYGVDILKVQEIRGWQDVTNIPNAPKHIRGVMNLRGAIVPVLDMRRRFGMPEIALTQNTVVIIVNVLGRTIGVVVDGVSDVVDIEQEALRPTPDFGSNIDASFISGLAAIGNVMVIILNIENMLKASDLISIDQIVEAEEEDAQHGE